MLTPFVIILTARSVPRPSTDGKGFQHLNLELIYILQMGDAFRDPKSKQSSEPGPLDFSVDSHFIISVLILMGLGEFYLGVLLPDNQRVPHLEETCTKLSHYSKDAS